MTRFYFSIILIPLGLIAGMLIRSRLNRYSDADQRNNKFRKKLQILALLILNPIAFLGAVWILPLDNLEIIYLPFLGILAIVLSGVYSITYTRIRKLPRKQRGSHFCTSYFTNIGSIGGLMAFALLGEPGYVLMPFYKLFEVIMYFGIGFPIASRFSENDRAKGRSLLEILRDPFIMISMGAIVIGLILNISGVERPSFYAALNSILIPLGSALLLIAIGMAMHFGRMKTHSLSVLSVSAIKFILVPLSVSAIAYLLGMGRILDGIPLKAVFILSSMPAGFVAIMPADLYKLDLDYANAAWLSTMLAMIAVVPWLYFALKYLFPYLL